LKDPTIKKPTYLALEVLDPRLETKLQTFVRRPNSRKLEKDLREQLELEDWGSSWEVYKELILLAHQLKIQIKGLKSEHFSLQQRDQASAKIIAKLKANCWILFGEFHCARPHLPAEVLKHSPAQKLLVIQQNTDNLHLKHLESMTPKKDLIFEDTQNRRIPLFCILHTPLWIKWQSYLDHQIQKQNEIYSIDAQDQIAWSLKTLYSFLKDPRYPRALSIDDILDFNVISVEDEDFIYALSNLSKKKALAVRTQLESSRIAILLQERKIFLSEVTLNSCAQAAGSYLYRSWSNLKAPAESFYQKSLLECMSFFLSKVLNHSRKAKHWRDWKRAFKNTDQSENLQSILEAREFSKHFSDRRAWLEKIRNHESSTAVALGRVIADLAFEAFLAGEFSKERLNRLLSEFPKTEIGCFERLVELKSVGQEFAPTKRDFW